MPKVRPLDDAGNAYAFYCPGCRHEHVYYINIDSRPHWQFNGDLESPSFTPSLLNRWGKYADPNWQEPDDVAPDEPGSWSGVCHLFVTNGVIDYCGDCTHDHNGRQAVPMKEYKDGMWQ